jgi:hypothetical protein
MNHLKSEENSPKIKYDSFRKANLLGTTPKANHPPFNNMALFSQSDRENVGNKKSKGLFKFIIYVFRFLCTIWRLI